MRESYVMPMIGDLVVLKQVRKVKTFYNKIYEIPKDKLLIIISSIGGSLSLLSGKTVGVWYLKLITEEGTEYNLVLRGGLITDDSDMKECLFDKDIYLIQRKALCVT